MLNGTLYDAIQACVVQALRGLYIGMPGRLEAYDHASGRGTVKPLIQEPDADGNLQSLKPIASVPVIMPGGGQAALYLPPKIGDTGWIAFSHRSMELWLDRGGDAPPGDPRIMDMTDAVFWPGLQPFSAGSLGEEEGAAVLRNGEAKLKMKDGKVALGNNQAELLDIVDRLITAITTAQCATPGLILVPQPPTAFSALTLDLLKIKGSL